jgi:predicted secreted protein
MLRTNHPLFDPATDAPVAAASSVPPVNFNENTETVGIDGFTDVGDSPVGTIMEVSPLAPPINPTAPVPNPAQRTAEDVFEPEPVPAALQPAPAPAPAPAKPAEQAPVDPVAAMASAMRAAHPHESAAQISARVAAALAEPGEEEAGEHEADPELIALQDMDTRLEALRQQANEEGTSDYDQDIRNLELEKTKVEARREMRQELAEGQQIDAFSREATTWDQEAGRAFPAADQAGHPLANAVNARVAAIKAQDPDFFIRSPDAGFSLVASEAAKLGIAPIAKQTGPVPSPQQPVPIAAPVAMPGYVQGSHRPADGPAPDPTMAFLNRMADAEKSGSFASQLDAARSFSSGGFNAAGVAFAG